MKQITRRIVALLASAVTAITTLSVSYSVAFAEETHETEASLEDNDFEIQSGGLLGELMPNEFKNLAKENDEARNSDYVIYRLDFDEAMENLIVSYSAKEDCTLFVGFYNDEDNQLFTSLTDILPAGVEQFGVINLPDIDNEYYTVKAFMVGQFRNPLTAPCENREKTKKVQGIIQKKPDDFNEKKVIKFTDDDDYNFIVTKNEYLFIYSNDKRDTIYDVNEEQNTVTFKNIDRIKDVMVGQDVLVKTEENMMFFRVDDIVINDMTVVVTRQNIDFNSMVDYVKFDYSKYKGEVKTSIKDCDDELISNYYVVDEETTSIGSNGDNSRKPLSPIAKMWLNGDHSISKKFHYDLLSKQKGDFKINGFFEYGIDIQLKIYYYDDYFNMTGNYTKSFELKVEGETDLFELSLGEVSFIVFPFSISIIPKIKMSLNASLSYSYSIKYDFDIDPYGISSITEHRPENDISGEASIELSFSLDIGVNFIDDGVLRISLEPEVGIDLKCEGSDVSENDYTRHDCDNCVSLSLDCFFKLSVHFKILGKDLLGSNILKKTLENSSAEGEYSKRIKEWHIKNGNAYDGPCDNISHKIILHVKEIITDDKGKTTTEPVKGASVYNGNYVSSEALFVNDSGNAILTDERGNVSLWIKDKELSEEDYCVTVKTPGDKVTTVRVGRNWNPNLKKANEFDAVIDEESISIEPDAGLSYPISGNCGFKVDTMLETEETVYENVTFDYFSDGECWVLGNGDLDGNKLFNELTKKNVKGINKLLIGRGVNISNRTYLNVGLPIEEIEFMGDNGKVLTQACIPESLKEITLSDFEEIEYNAFYSPKYVNNNTLRPLKVNFPNSIKVIGHDAFRSTDIEEIVFPKKLKRIESIAFAGCKNLTSIKLNEGLEEIKTDAFSNTNITSVNIPKSVKNLEHQAFWNCQKLKTVTINGDFINNWVIPFDHSKVETLIINDGVTKINDGFFSSQEELKNVRFSKNLKSIGNSAFIATAIENVNLPDSLVYIGDNAFYNTKIKSLSIPKNVSYIGDNAFGHNPITSLELSEGLSYIGSSAFSSTKLYSVTIPESVSFIGANAFNNGSYLNDNKLDSSSINELSSITILNPNCNIEKNIVSKKTTIYGYTGSTAETYALANGNPFKALDAPVVTTTAATTTTTTTVTTTTTAAVVTTQIAPDAECVFIAVKDENTVNGSAEELLDKDNVKFFDQKTADSDGVVSFSYLPDEKEKWAFIFVSEAINDTITKAFGTPDDLKTTTYNVAPGVKGDANGDGQLDMSDVVLIMQALANPNKYGINGIAPSHITVEGTMFGDTDGDGLTGMDALRIQQYLLGLIPSLT